MALGSITRPAFPGASIDYVEGNKRIRTRDVQLTSGANYTTGGETISPTAVGLSRRIDRVIAAGVARTTTGGAATIPLSFDFATTPGSVLMQQYVAATGAEQAGNANLSTFSVRLTFVGV